MSDETKKLFARYLGGEMGRQEAKEFEDRLEADEELLTDFLHYQESDSVITKLSDIDAPDDFDAAVQARIRRRSRGRFFADRHKPHQRFYTEIFVGVSAVVLGAVYLFAIPDRELRGAEFEEIPVDTAPADDAPVGPGSGAPPDASDDGSVLEAEEDEEAASDEADAAPHDETTDHIGVARQARSGSVSGLPTVDARVEGFAYSVTVDMDFDALGDRLRRQFPGQVVESDGSFAVTFPREDFEAGLVRLSELGTVGRSRTEIVDRQTQTIVVNVADSQ